MVMMPTSARPFDTVLNHFPLPRFLTMPSVGVDISDRSMKFIELEHRSGGRIPTRFGSCSLEPGVIKGGKIYDPEKLERALTELRKENDFSFVRASLPEQQAYVFKMNVPVTHDEAQIVQTIEFKLEENVPLSPGEVVLAYDVLGPRHEDDSTMEITVIAYPRENVERYVNSLEGAGLTPLSLEIESQAIARSVIGCSDPDTYLVVDFGETRTGLAIVTNGLLAFTSTLEVRGRELTEAIKVHQGVSSKDVASFKNEEGIQVEHENKELQEKLTHVVEALSRGIEKHYSYWNEHAGKSDMQKIKKIVLCGGNANLAGLPEYLSTQLRVSVERANVWTNAFSFDIEVPGISFEQSLSYATVIGLALRGE